MSQGNKLFVGSLPYSVRDEHLGQIFAEIGQVVSAKVIMDNESGRSKGFGFVEMSSAEEAKTAVEKLNGATVEGRQILVSEARPQRAGGGSGGSRGGFGGGSGGGYNSRNGGGRDGGSRSW